MTRDVFDGAAVVVILLALAVFGYGLVYCAAVFAAGAS